MGYLYVLNCGVHTKIGISNDVRGRLAQLQTGNPVQISLRGVWEFDNPLPVESSLHQAFSKQRGIGEWFLLNEEQLQYISVICDMLGGRIAGNELLAFAPNTDVLEIDDNEESEAVPKPRGFTIYDEEGYRLQTKHSGKYYEWVTGSYGDRKYKPGGLVSDLPQDMQDKINARRGTS
jgi:hypothetical protein